MDYEYAVNPVTGGIRYALYTDLWSPTPKRGLPRSRRQARTVAEEYLARLSDLCGRQDYLALEIPPLLPSGPASYEHLETTKVFHPEHARLDHFLVSFATRIRPYTDRRDLVPVSGGTIEIRVGQLGRVVGYTSAWRPSYLRPVIPPASYVPLASEDRARTEHEHEDGHGHAGTKHGGRHAESGDHAQPKELEGHHAASEGQSLLAYVLDGESSPQNSLCPYHLVTSGHHYTFHPASSHSLTPYFHQVDNPDGSATVHGMVAGGSGDNLFSWAVYRIDEIWDRGVEAAGSGREDRFRRSDGVVSTYSTIDLPPGACTVVLHVMDATTGVVKQAQQSIYTKPVVAPEPVDAAEPVDAPEAVSVPA